MRPGESGVLAEIRGLRHHDHNGTGACHAGPTMTYKRGHLFHSDRGHRLVHRLNHMGLIPGVQVKVLRNNAPGPVIVAVKDTRLCLGRGVANKVMVRPGADGDRSPAREES
jgi:ferrous iron transport protein A